MVIKKAELIVADDWCNRELVEEKGAIIPIKIPKEVKKQIRKILKKQNKNRKKEIKRRK